MWVFYFVLTIVILIWLKMASNETYEGCEDAGTCSCLKEFEHTFSGYVAFITVLMVVKVQTGYQAAKFTSTRRELKVKTRRVNMIFGMLHQAITAACIVTLRMAQKDEGC